MPVVFIWCAGWALVQLPCRGSACRAGTGKPTAHFDVRSRVGPLLARQISVSVALRTLACSSWPPYEEVAIQQLGLNHAPSIVKPVVLPTRPQLRLTIKTEWAGVVEEPEDSPVSRGAWLSVAQHQECHCSSTHSCAPRNCRECEDNVLAAPSVFTHDVTGMFTRSVRQLLL
ncbi:uncharacterized protein LOC142566826 isoform X1 [Dermacentor variabilis]|uniref:uncharacterized protein LOC142566826 isoform X1 n=1 Tax=Dermacentor variabilis TaxID=34621 RepID=UPI003F5BC8AC